MTVDGDSRLYIAVIHGEIEPLGRRHMLLWKSRSFVAGQAGRTLR